MHCKLSPGVWEPALSLPNGWPPQVSIGGGWSGIRDPSSFVRVRLSGSPMMKGDEAAEKYLWENAKAAYKWFDCPAEVTKK